MFPSRRGVDRGMTGLERCADGLSSEGRKITATFARWVSEVEGEMVKLKREREAVKSDRTVRSYHVSSPHPVITPLSSHPASRGTGR